MADLFLQNFKQSFSISDTEFINHFQGLIPIHHQENLPLNFMGFPNHNIFPPQDPGNLENFPGLFIHDEKTAVTSPMTITNPNDQKGKKRKAKDISTTPETTSPNSSAYSSPQVSDNAITKPNRGGRGKKAKDNGKGDEKAGEVIHVRARRGQATDSHSLAERVRRGKINERLRCLQDIVPGCYKTMGMAVMLDEIINYVQSLQNQVEFLSMKLTTASAFHDFDSETDAIMKTASQGIVPNAQMNFGYYPQFPHSL